MTALLSLSHGMTTSGVTGNNFLIFHLNPDVSQLYLSGSLKIANDA
jgi:hypothetical protein